jgi:hypothetical protein
MSTESIFGSWNTPRVSGDYLLDKLQGIFHTTAAQNVGKPEFQPNSGLSQRKHEICMLWSLFNFQKPMVTVEVGTSQGGTFAGWCELSPAGATLISIDRCINDCRPRPNEPVHPSIYNGPLRMSEQGGGVYSLGKKGQTIHAINGWTYEQSTQDQLLALLKGRKIQFLYHDASHDFEGSMRDFEWLWPLMDEGSVMAFHDIMPSKAEGVTKSKFWEWVKKTVDYSACYEFTSSRDEDSLGQGVLIK